MKLPVLIVLTVLPALVLADESKVPGKPIPTSKQSTAPSSAVGPGGTPAASHPPQGAAASANTPAENAKPPEDPNLKLRANVHAMRIAIEQDEAAEQFANRVGGSLLMPTQDSGAISTLRSQLNDSMAHLDNRCIGVNARNNGGNLVLVCGDNNGQTQSSVSETRVSLQPGTSGTTLVSSPTAQPAASIATASNAPAAPMTSATYAPPAQSATPTAGASAATANPGGSP